MASPFSHVSTAASPNLLATARTLGIDAITAEVLAGLDAIGCRAILLKGPALRRALYDDGELRSYVDADLLVSPSDLPRASDLLAELGFVLRMDERDRPGALEPHHHDVWDRSWATVELHWRLAGIGAPPDVAWRVLAAGTEPITVAGAAGESLDRTRTALLVALHAAQHGVDAAQPREDLERALDRFGFEVWSGAKPIAAALDALEAFAAGLRLSARGRLLAADLQLPRVRSPRVRLAAAQQPAGSLRLLEIVASSVSLRDRGRMVLQSAFPAPEQLRRWSPLARRGPAGLALAYPRRWLAQARNLPAAIRAVRRARRPPA